MLQRAASLDRLIGWEALLELDPMVHLAEWES